MSKKAVVALSSSINSALCLSIAAKSFGKENVSALFLDDQAKRIALNQAKKIAKDLKIELHELKISYPIALKSKKKENSQDLGAKHLVQNIGVIIRYAAIFADYLEANVLYLGESKQSRIDISPKSFSREYFDLKQQLLQIDLDNPQFQIKTPLIDMTKKQVLLFAYELGVLEYLLENTLNCRQSILKNGCGYCPPCKDLNKAIHEFLIDFPSFKMPYRLNP